LTKLRHGFLLALSFGICLGGDVRWTVVEGFLSDEGAVFGSFVYDSTTQTVKDWSLSVAGGNVTQFPDFTYTPATSSVSIVGQTIVFQGALNPAINPAPNGFRQLRLGPFIQPLTDAGGTALSTEDSFGNLECYNCFPSRSVFVQLQGTPLPDMTIAKSHSGNFFAGQTGAAYTIQVFNSGVGPTTSRVSVTDTLPAGFTATGMSGSGWSCTLATLTCTRSDALASGFGYPAITLTVNVAAGAAATSTNTVTVSGGGEFTTTNNSATDPTNVLYPNMTVTKTHTGNFAQGQTGATFTITARNSGFSTTFSPVTVVDALPAGLTATAISGPGWSCTLAPLSCSRSDALAGSTSYPAITLTVNVAGTAPPVLTNSVTVSGGGEITTGDNTAADIVNITAGADLTITKTHTGSFVQQQTGASYTITVRNAGLGSTAGAVSVTDILPASLTPTSLSGPGWFCTIQTLTCTRSDALAAGASYSPILLIVNVGPSAPSLVTNSATVVGGGELNTANNTATDATQVIPLIQVSFSTIPFGLSYSVDGTGYTSAQTLRLPAGSTHTIATSSPQLLNNLRHVFSRWSDGGAISHTIVIPSSSSSYVAEFAATSPPLTVTTQSLGSATVGTSFSGSLSASGGVPPYSWSASGAPDWLNVTASGSLTGVPVPGSAGSFSVNVTVTDSTGESASATLPLTVRTAPLVIAPFQIGPVTEGAPVQASFRATGGNGGYIWSAGSLPSWLSITRSGVLSGTPPAGSAGTYAISIVVTDSSGASTSAGSSLLVNPPPLSITSSNPLPAASEGTPYRAGLSAAGGAPPYTWSGGGPTWLTVGADGSLSGTPPSGSAGTYGVTAAVRDSKGATASGTFSISVSAASTPLSIQTNAIGPARVGQPFVSGLSAAGGRPPYRWTPREIVTGIAISSDGVVTGKAGAPQNGSFTAEVRDAAGSVALKEISFAILADEVSVQSGGLAAGVVGKEYFEQLTAAGGSGQYRWSLTSGSLPQGLSLSPLGVLSGTPRNPGNFNFTVTASDATPPPSSSSPLKANDHRDAAPASAAAAQLRLNIQGAADLIVSAGALAFKAIAGGPNPTGATIAVISSSSTQIPFSVDTDAAWLAVTQSSASTPATVTLAPATGGLTPGNYSGNISFVRAGREPLKLGVSLVVTSGTPDLTTSPAIINLAGRSGATQTANAVIYARNAGSGFLGFSTRIVDAPWLAATPSAGSLLPNQTQAIALSASSAALQPGFYSGRVEIATNSGTASVVVTLFVAEQSRLVLSSSGVLLESREGAGVSGPAVQSFTVLGSDASPLRWSARQVGGEGFLSLVNSTGVSTNETPQTVSFQVKPELLKTGPYYARILVESPDAANSPQEFVVVLNVSPAQTPQTPNPLPAGLVFITPQGQRPTSQTIQVFTSGMGPVAFQIASLTEDGGDWLTATPRSGMVSTGSPARLTVSVDPGVLKPGVYRGVVSISQSNIFVRSVNVTLTVTAPDSQPRAARAAAGCTPQRIVATHVGLTTNFSSPAGWPRTIAVRLNDDCGALLASGDVVANFSNGDAPVRLSLSDPATATYSATWVPAKAQPQITVTATASVAGLPNASAAVVGGVVPNIVPVLARNGILHNFNPVLGGTLAPGTVITIYGTALAAGTIAPQAVPLPTTLDGTTVIVGGIPAPLFFVSPGQINAQLPYQLIAGREYQVVVQADAALTNPEPIQLAPLAPGVARLADGRAIAQHADFSLVTAESPAKPGENLVIYLAGMGLTDNAVASGAVSPAEPLARVSSDLEVTLGSKPVKLFFAGLTPGLVGIYQINFQVPEDAASGDLVLSVQQAGVPANTSLLPVAR
jgi:uncharacterized protein (TIGR03437 family)